MQFYLGLPKAHWLGLTDVPAFVSYRVLAPRRGLPRALGPWIQDSGAFTELSLHGTQTVSPQQYAARTRRHRDEMGNMTCAVIQDWMCEPHMLARTGLTISAHQDRTVTSFLMLRELEPDMAWMPVIQGWGLSDYLRCIDLYDRAGVDLRRQPLVGIGSVCRRQASAEAATIIRTIAECGIAVHGFGVKIRGLRMVAGSIASSDSMAWALHARRRPALSGHAHRNCASCLPYALQWRDRVLAGLTNQPLSYQIPLEFSA